MKAAHRSRQTQRVLDSDGLTTALEKLSKVRGPLYPMAAKPLNRPLKSTLPVPR